MSCSAASFLTSGVTYGLSTPSAVAGSLSAGACWVVSGLAGAGAAYGNGGADSAWAGG